MTPTDNELINSFNDYIEMYTKRGNKHYCDTPDWKIKELYIDLIYDRILSDICEEDDTKDELIERLNQLM